MHCVGPSTHQRPEHEHLPCVGADKSQLADVRLKQLCARVSSSKEKDKISKSITDEMQH
jgi:hypothetical protein